MLAELARGGAGIVYRARQYEPAREVALKMLLPQQMGSDEMVARFRIEAETIAALDHPASLPIYTVGVHREMPFFTMKLALGGTLAGRRIAYRGAWRRTAELV
ncbi:MAG: serine/threonine protein kinase, partial [Acidobacteria bacterium]|nr:serine/threonine protein kinase [Acidobacteriota bacterium]